MTIINTLVGSQFVYKMSVLPNVPPSFLKKMEQKMVDFIWCKKRPKIPLRILKMDKKHGGLRLVDLEKKEASLKASWIPVLKQNSKLANLVYYFIAPLLQEDIWRCNFKREHAGPSVPIQQKPLLGPSSREAWSSFNFKPEKDDIDHFLWFNSNISD